jgi:hypothetical protein
MLDTSRGGARLAKMCDWSLWHAVECSPGWVSEGFVFRGTGVAGAALFWNLENGMRGDDFAGWFPGGDERAGRSSA